LCPGICGSSRGDGKLSLPCLGRLPDVTPSPFRSRLPARRLLPFALLLLAMSGCRFGAPPGATEQGRRIGNLYHLMFYIAIGVAAVVYLRILWQWRLQYPAQHVQIVGTPQQPPTLVVPVGKTIQVSRRAADVNHAFFVPAFLFKRDAIPGIDNHFDLNVTRAGTFVGECAE